VQYSEEIIWNKEQRIVRRCGKEKERRAGQRIISNTEIEGCDERASNNKA
jgi:hypothetical protein